MSCASRCWWAFRGNLSLAAPLRTMVTDAKVTDRLFGTLAAETVAIMKGAHIIRTHDVRVCVDAVRIRQIWLARRFSATSPTWPVKLSFYTDNASANFRIISDSSFLFQAIPMSHSA